MKIVFAGSPDFAVAPFKALLDGGKQVVAVITRPDKPYGRKGVITPTPVKVCAREYGVPVYDFSKLSEHVEEVRSLGADVMITCAYGQILSRAVLDCFPLGVYNLHASLLPLFRGASPIQSAILAGERYTGVTVMRTEEALDSGDMLLVKRCETGEKTCGELSKELSALAAQAAVEAVELLERGDVQLLVQDEARATYCSKISKEDCKIDFNQPAEKIVRAVKAFSPQPAAYCYLNGVCVNVLNARVCESSDEALKSGETELKSAGAGTVFKVDKKGVAVSCGSGAVNITLLQFAGGRQMSAADAFNGRKIKAGDRFD